MTLTEYYKSLVNSGYGQDFDKKAFLSGIDYCRTRLHDHLMAQPIEELEKLAKAYFEIYEQDNYSNAGGVAEYIMFIINAKRRLEA